MLKLIARGLLGLLIIVVVAAVAAFGYRAWRQHEGEKALVISSPNGIDEAIFVPINGTEQWIAIRGQDRRKPVLLIVSGGPGFSTYPAMTRFLPYEKDYVVVHWDQPGTAKTFARAGNRLPPDTKVNDYVTDGIAVTEYLKTHLHKDKVIVLGWSWGSMVGIEMVRARPDLFSAYVGTGQEVNQPRGEKIVYQSVLAEARRRGAKQAVEELEAIGPPPYGSSSEVRIQRVWAMRFEGTGLEFFLSLILLAPRYSLGDELSWVRGVLASGDVLVGSDMKGPMTQVDFAAESLTFQVPIFVIHGAEDCWVPAELARAWVESLSAPVKEFIPMEGAAHFALMLHSDEFVKIMNERLRPLTSVSE